VCNAKYLILYKYRLARTPFIKIKKCNHLSTSHSWIKLKIIIVNVIQQRVIKIFNFMFRTYIKFNTYNI